MWVRSLVLPVCLRFFPFGWGNSLLALDRLCCISQKYVPFAVVFLSRQGASLFESGQSPSSLLGGIMHGTLSARHTATPLYA